MMKSKSMKQEQRIKKNPKQSEVTIVDAAREAVDVETLIVDKDSSSTESQEVPEAEVKEDAVAFNGEASDAETLVINVCFVVMIITRPNVQIGAILRPVSTSFLVWQSMA